jgi:hypothetical protein
MIERLESRLLLAAQAYDWQNVAIGAGGFVDGIFYSPTQQNVIYARTDIGGLYKSTNDGQSWSQLLDFVGNNASTSGNGTQSQEIGVLSFAIDPQNPNNLYADVGQYSGTNGDVLYSTDGGQTWGQMALSFYVGGNSNGRGDGEQIAVDPNDSSIIFLGSNANGLWESTNAGHSFTQVSSFSPTSTTFVLFDPTSGTPGNPSQTIYVGDDSTSSGTNLYKTTNGGTTWSQLSGTGTLPSGYLPGRAVLSGGNLYLAYANVQVPATTSAGGVFRYTPTSGAWANISPISGSFGFAGVAADPSNPNTIVVSTFDHYSGPDQIWRSVNANASTPTWTELYDYSTAQNSGFNGFDTTRNYSGAAWIATFGDGAGNWISAIAINPFNSNQLMYGTGAGIWATNNASNNGTNTQLTAANSWYFPDDGIEFTNADWVAAAPSGTPLFSTVWDINGFAHTTLTQSPANGAIVPATGVIASSVLGTMDSIDFAGTNPSDDAAVGIVGTNDGVYSTNDGITWTYFGSKPSGASGGSVAVTSTGGTTMTIVWAPSGKAPYYSTNNGSSWTASGGSPTTGGTVVADRLNPSDFYYYVGSKVYFSSNSGVSFTLETSSAPSGGKIAVNPFISGDLWIAASGGVYHSTNDGASFTHVSSISTNGVIALGAAAPGQTTPAIYVFGTISGFLGIYRSDDGGGTWTLINSTSQQWGGMVQYMAADPNVFGRVYLAVNGRGIIMGNPASSLPSNWADADIYTPGNPGWATSSTTLSNGTVVSQWTVVGGGAGLSGSSFSVNSLSSSTLADGESVATVVTSGANHFNVGDLVTIAGATPAAYDGTYQVSSIVNSTTFTFIVTPGLAAASGTITAATQDQFNFAYEPYSGSVTVSAQLLSMTNADNGKGTPVAGVMIRSSTDDNDPFVAMVQTAGGSLEFEYRTTTGGAVTTVTLGGVPVGSEYVQIIRSGSNFSGYFSSNGSTWTQLGTTVSITAMPSTANVGLAATANFNSQLTSATFANVSVTAPAATVANEYLFYYGSSAFDNSATSPSSADQNAIATDKSALVSGPTATTATFTNISSYFDGINGILIDFANLPAGVSFSASDFQFNVGNTSNSSSWSSAPAPTSVATWTGSNGDTFADIVWANNAIEEEWLQVTVLADANTHLASNFTFYYGSEIGATGISTATTGNGPVIRVTSADVVATQNNASLLQSVPITNLYDYNRDGKVTAADIVLCQNNTTLLGGLELITVGGSSGNTLPAHSKAASTRSAAVAAVTRTIPISSDTSITASSTTNAVLDSSTDDLLVRTPLKHW